MRLVSKLMEKIIVEQMLKYLLTNNLISKQQHGFLSRRSTATNLIESLNDWTVKMENRQGQSVAYIDFAKAFDSVSHPKLLTKLGAYGIGGVLLNWISDFLTGRSHVTRVGHCLSPIAFITSGVIQGSCLGPLLFLLYINDLAEAISAVATMKLYADDVKLYSNMSAVPTNANVLQDQLNRLLQWSVVWQLPISFMKCCILNIGKANESCVQLLLGQSILPALSEVSDLGVVVDSDLRFSHNVNKIVSKAHKRANLILRCFITRDILSLTNAFKVYVRPILEYCSVVWCPHLVKDIDSIEKVQRRFTKRLPGMNNMTYYQRLRALGLESLELRRIRIDLLFTYKIMFGLVDLNRSDFFELSATDNRLTRGHRYKLMIPTTKNGVRYNYFSYRAVRVWNILPTTVCFNSFSSFKNSLSAELLTRFCKVNFT